MATAIGDLLGRLRRNLLGRERRTGGVRRAMLGVGGLSVLGLALSLLTQVVTSAYFGTSAALDGYWIAYSWIMLATFFVMPFREALVPAVFARLSQESREDAASYLADHLGWLLAALALATLATVGAAWFLAHRPGGAGAADHVASSLIWLAPAVIVYSLAEVFNGLLACFNRPVLQQAIRLGAPLVTLAAILLLARRMGVEALGLGFVLGQALLVLFQGYHLGRLGLPLRLRLPRRLDRTILVLGGSLVVVYLFSQVYAFAARLAFAHMQGGLVSAFQYATAMTNGLITLFGSVAATALFPSLLDAGARQDHAHMARILGRASHWLVFLTVGVCTAFWVFAPEIVRLVFQRGHFSAASAALTVEGLRMAVFTTVPVSLSTLLIRAILSQRSGRVVSVGTTGMSMALGGLAILGVATWFGSQTLLLSHWLVGNALGAVISLYWVLRRLGRDAGPFVAGLRRGALAAIPAAGAAWLARQGGGFVAGALPVLGLGGVFYCLVYLLGCKAMGVLPDLGGASTGGERKP